MDVVMEGYYPGLAGDMIAIHARHYIRAMAFDSSFETRIGEEVCTFFARFDQSRDGIWAVRSADSLAGCAAIVGQDPHGARLRWFIVAPDIRKQGLGSRLLSRAVDFCRDCGHPFVYFWTVGGLDKAHRLYERHGFRLALEENVRQWGREMTKQKFVLDFDD